METVGFGGEGRDVEPHRMRRVQLDAFVAELGDEPHPRRQLPKVEDRRIDDVAELHRRASLRPPRRQPAGSRRVSRSPARVTEDQRQVGFREERAVAPNHVERLRVRACHPRTDRVVGAPRQAPRPERPVDPLEDLDLFLVGILGLVARPVVEAGHLDADIRMLRQRDEPSEIRRIEAVDGPDDPLMVKEDRERRMSGREPTDVLEPGRAHGQARDEVPFGGQGEERVAFGSDEPAVVLLRDVVGEPSDRPAVCHRTQPIDRSRRVVFGRPRTVDVGERDDPVGVPSRRAGHVFVVVGIEVDPRADEDRPIDAVAVHLEQQLLDPAA